MNLAVPEPLPGELSMMTTSTFDTTAADASYLVGRASYEALTPRNRIERDFLRATMTR